MLDELRPSRGRGVAYIVVMFGLALATCIRATGTDLVPWPAGREFYYAHPLVVLLGGAIVGTVWAVRFLRRGVYSRDRGLVVRQLFWTRTIPWEAIQNVVAIRIWGPSRYHRSSYVFIPVVKYLSPRRRRRSARLGMLSSYFESEVETVVEQLKDLIAAGTPHRRSKSKGSGELHQHTAKRHPSSETSS
jgi:hypothetical protein